MMMSEKLRGRADAMEQGLGVTFGDTPMALREAADEIQRLRFLLQSLRDNFSSPGQHPLWKLEMACKIIDQALSN